MLDDFLVEQSVAYKIMKNSILNDRCSHAYLINTNGYHKGFDMAKAFAKYILCNEKKCNDLNCNFCRQCNMIDQGVYSDLKIINNDGLWIKKSQTDELQFEFSMKSVSSGKKVYIINGVENLNIAASNSILKFLEEPEENIIAILVCDNINNVLETIISRCQVINLKLSSLLSDNMLYNVANSFFNDDEKINSFINAENSLDRISKVINFIRYVTLNKNDAIVYIEELWNSFFINKEDYLFAFDIIILFLTDIINYKIGHPIVLKDYLELIEEYSDYDLKKITAMLNLSLEIKNELYSNVNLNLLMDKFIILMGEI